LLQAEAAWKAEMQAAKGAKEAERQAALEVQLFLPFVVYS